ncbi:MAG: PepSY-associated TM helix domain-containing protein [Nostoc sp.]
MLIIVGLTGSLLVFQREIDEFLVSQQFGQVTPKGDRLPIESVLETVKTSYAKQPDIKISSVNTLPDPYFPCRFWLQAANNESLQVLVNPYTGIIMGSHNWDETIISWTFKLHYQLLAGEIGTIIVGIVAFMLLILSITGIVLWSGWRILSGVAETRHMYQKSSMTFNGGKYFFTGSGLAPSSLPSVPHSLFSTPQN